MDHKRVKPKDKRDRYLILDPCGVYMVRIAVPAYMAAHFGNKTYFMRSTVTRDIRQARLFRDAIALEWYKLRDQLKPVRSGSRIEQILDELRGIRKYANETPAAALPQSTQVNFGAQVMACPSLLKMRDLYILQFSEKRKLTTLSKTNKAVEVLLSHLRKRDIPLKDINRTIVTGWLDKLKSDRAPQTIQNYISALAQIWDLARNRYHDAPQDNPWRGHGLEAKSSKVSYEVFTHAELAKVFAALDGDEEMQAVTLIGMYSGMRLNEICSLRVGNIREIEGVFASRSQKAKPNRRRVSSRFIVALLIWWNLFSRSPITGFSSTARQSLTVQTASALRGIHSVSRGLNGRHWARLERSGRCSIACAMRWPNSLIGIRFQRIELHY